MKQCKAGAVVAADEQGRLQGIFTHGDFVRAYQEDRDMADHLIKDHMTTNPITIQGDKLAAEAVHVLEDNRIDEIVVIDSTQTVIGLVDVQDLRAVKYSNPRSMNYPAEPSEKPLKLLFVKLKHIGDALLLAQHWKPCAIIIPTQKFGLWCAGELKVY